jgi:predicted acyl esterase
VTRSTSTSRPSSATCPTLIAWLAAQDWCDGRSACGARRTPASTRCRSACEQPPELKAICAIYATDDRWTDDVHWRGGALRLVDLVDY